MPIKQITPAQAIESYLNKEIAKKEKAILYKLSYVGEACVNEARTSGQYIDQTGNLRSSIGYIITKDGTIVQQSGFQQVKDGAAGTKDGEAFARQLASKFPTGICLIVVAGMNYAGYVSAKGYNVMDSSEDLAEKLVPQVMKQLGFIVK